ncbi:solute carrier family 2, facilitated glucose transporter member 3-like [Astyanax mexicanus]|uniref:Solute carrier family 2, facilitated glucose transporter member 5 n=1 Tax=Astyanax mexicanus TaxID=7994 RepID=A0A8T2LYZ9_ASTMX|nr:solute carrier family 2, facilitated glucose transporter member 3-like [Astyanax mexicanus]
MCVILSLLQRNRMTCHLLFCVCTAAIGSLQFGYNIGVINAPYKKVQAFFKNASLERYGQAMDDCTVSNLWSFAVAVFSAGGMVSSVFVGALVNKFGRTKSMLLSNTLALIGGALMGLASACRSYEMVILGRLVIGLFCGLYTGLTPMYVGELAPTAQRGAFGTLHQLAIVIGILIAQILGLEVLLGSEYLWPLLLGLTALPAVLQSVMLIFCSESPRYLLINLKQEEEARRILVLLRGQEDVEDDIREMKEEADKLNQEQKVSIPELFRNPIYRQPIIIAIVMNVSQQFSGINAVFYYSTQIFKSSGVSEPIYATIGTGIINTVFTVVSLFLVERAGRRTLQMFGLGGMAICALVMTIVLQLVLDPCAPQEDLCAAPVVCNGTVAVTSDASSKTPVISYVAILAVFGFVASFEIGPGPIPWFIATELFAQDARPAAVAVGGCSNWISNFLVAMFFPMLQRACGPYVFIIFLVLLLFFLLFTYFRVPETKGRTFEDIASGFAKAASSAPANPAPLEGGDTLPVSPTTEKVPMVEFPPQEAANNVPNA